MVLPLLAFSRQAFLCLNSLWCLLRSSPEGTNIGTKLHMVLPPTPVHGPCGFYLSQTGGGGGKCQSFSELCCKCTYGWISHLLSWLTTWVFLDVLWTYIVGSIVSRPVLRHDSAVAGFANVGSVPLVVAGGPCVPQV